MRRRPARIALLLLGLGLFLQSFVPSRVAERVLELLSGPFFLWTELTSPLALLRTGEVAAAEEGLKGSAQALAEESRELLVDLARSAEPTEPELRAGRRIVHALVLGREGEKLDRVRVRLRDARGVVPGLPVACGDAFVGRLIEVAPAANDIAPAGNDIAPAGNDIGGTALVELVTAKAFQVGARVHGEGGVLMTVGGLAPGKKTRGEPLGAREIRLALSYPSDPELLGGLARVHELFREPEDLGALAEGLHLGQVRHEESDDSWWIAPELDFKDGLSHLVVLCPPNERLGSSLPFEPVLVDDNWVKARPLALGDPSPWRSAVPISVGEVDQVRPGAAVTSVGLNLVGRVARVRRWSAELSFLDDPGLALVAIARFEAEDRPVVLGRLLSDGRGEEGWVCFRWIVRAPLGVEEAHGLRRARLFTGAGDAGLPAGFFIGEAELPLDAVPGEVREIRVETALDPTQAHALFVRTGEGLP